MSKCVVLQSVEIEGFKVVPMGSLTMARSLKGEGGRFRAPHHSCSVTTVLGELCIAAGPKSVLYLDEAQGFSGQSMREVTRYWNDMDPEVRPTLVVHLETGTRSSDGTWRPLPPMDERYEFIMGVVPMVDEHIIYGGIDNE